MIIDCMDWHYRDNYPDRLDKVHAATHIGVFIAWIIENNLESEILRKDSYNDIHNLRARKITVIRYFKISL